jgi:hypothetical protein
MIYFSIQNSSSCPVCDFYVLLIKLMALFCQFVTRAQEKTFSDEKKLQLMQGIAQEFSVRFDPKDVHRRLSNPAEAKYVSIWKFL